MDERPFRHRRLVFAAPHPDDAAFASGGLLAEAARRGMAITIVTFCTRTFYVDGQKGGDLDGPTARRRAEEEAYAALLGPTCRLVYRDYLDAIVRRDGGLEAVFDETWSDPEDPELAGRVAGDLALACREEGTALLLPLGLGHHADHLLVRRAGLGMERPPGVEAIYLWEDLPYAIDYEDAQIRQMAAEVAAGAGYRAEPLDIFYPGFGPIKQKGMDCYGSQDGDGGVSALTLKCGLRLRPDGGEERCWLLS